MAAGLSFIPKGTEMLHENHPMPRMGGQPMAEGGEGTQSDKSQASTFYIPAMPDAKVGDTLTVKVVAMDKGTGDLEVEFAGREAKKPESYTPEEPPEEAFS